MDRPLITFVVASYNQEAFIREAIESAFAQTYSPLEIIVSDDCSKDRTFEIAREMAAAYRGKHSIKLNRNETNLGIGGHANRIMELCRGELVVAAAGDDISLPMRTETIHQAWLHSGKRATSIFSSYKLISKDGAVGEIGGTRGDPNDPQLYRPQRGSLFEFLSTRLPVVVGCTHAWSPVLFQYFGPLRADLEDLTLSFRTLAIGELLYINQPLILYRRHGDNVSFFPGRDDAASFEHRERRLRWVDEKTAMAYENMLVDITTLHDKGRITGAERDRLAAEAKRIWNLYDLERRMMDHSMSARLRALAGAAGRGDFGHTLRFMPRALPRPLYRTLYLLREKWRVSTQTAKAR